MDGRITSPAGRVLMAFGGSVAGRDVAAIGGAHGESVPLSSC